MSSAREIVTLQFGHYSNFVGTHLWNLHEEQFANLPVFENRTNEINYDVLYREGLTNKGQVTFTPRVVLLDLKGSLRTLPQVSDLYETTTEEDFEPVWQEESLEVKKTDPEAKNEFLSKFERDNTLNFKLKDDDVKVWSDFLYGRFHPRSVNVIKEYSHEQPEFQNFEAGRQLWKDEQIQDDFMDKIRCYAEECDFMQGFQILQDIHNGFSGLSASCIEYLKDEYDKKSVISFPVFDDKLSSQNSEGVAHNNNLILNTVLLYDSLIQNASLFVPMSTSASIWGQNVPQRTFKYLRYNSNRPYHTSAILASALETFTIQYRMKNSWTTMRDIVVELAKHGKVCASASLLMPLNYRKYDSFGGFLDPEMEPLVSLTPNCDLSLVNCIQFFGLRGFTSSSLEKHPHLSNDGLFMYMDKKHDYSYNKVAHVERGLPLTGTFPRIIDRYASEPPHPQRPTLSNDLSTAQVIAGLHSHVKIGEMFGELLREEKKSRIATQEISKYGIELDNYKESIERLLEHEELYTLKRFYDE